MGERRRKEEKKEEEEGGEVALAGLGHGGRRWPGRCNRSGATSGPVQREGEELREKEE